MAQFENREQLIKAADEEIEKFFEETIFEGVFSSEIRSKKTMTSTKGALLILNWKASQLIL